MAASPYEDLTPARHRVIRDGIAAQIPDIDPGETSEWLDSFDAMIDAGGQQRARYVMLRMLARARERHVGLPALTTTDYINTIATENEPFFPGDEELERRYRAWIRWNAAVMVHRAQRPGIGVGGHISTYASSASLYEVGHNWFFRGKDHPGGGDHIFYQGHASPGMYARGFLEGRVSQEQLDGFRQEVSHPHGIPSYPHPRLMPNFWEHPTVSMGLGPMNAIQQARVNRYLHHRGIKDTSDQNIWAFLGDGELDEVESRGLIHIAAIDGLDNLNFVINCNLQRLDGPVRGNGKIIQELESFFRGAGWNVIKVVWGREWDALLGADRDGALVNLMNNTADGDYQTFKANDGAYVREHFFGRDPRTKQMVAGMTDDEIWGLRRGGHDYRKVYAAYKAATEHKGQPTVILAKTVKGFHLGPSFEGRNATHQMKKLTLDNLKAFRSELHIPIDDAQLEADPYQPPYFHPGSDSPEIAYLQERRQKLGGYVPERRNNAKPLVLPGDKVYDVLKRGSGKQEIATTMAFVRLVRDLVKDPEIGHRIVPIIPDEARTFGMDSFFPTLKIYNPHGQLYTAVDASLMLAYKESEAGQILHEGIDEAGSIATLTAVATSYATHGEPLIPIYVFYSMFGFQRTGDGLWAIGDQMGRGFVMGATAGRTTLTGEGLQHADGHSHLLAATQPHIVAYDPAYGFEIAHIIKDGLRRMYGASEEFPQGRERPVLHHHLQRAVRAAGGARRPRRRGAAQGHVPLLAGHRHRRQGARSAARLRRRAAVGVGGPAAAGHRLGRRGRRVVGDQLVGALSRGRADRAGPPARSEPARRALRHAAPAERPGAGDRDQRLAAGRAELDRTVGPDGLRGAGRGRVRLLRHPGGRSAALPHRRPVDGGRGVVGVGAAWRVPGRRRRRGRGEVPAQRSPGGPVRERGRRLIRAIPQPGPIPPVGLRGGTNRDRLLMTIRADGLAGATTHG